MEIHSVLIHDVLGYIGYNYLCFRNEIVSIVLLVPVSFSNVSKQCQQLSARLAVRVRFEIAFEG